MIHPEKRAAAESEAGEQDAILKIFLQRHGPKLSASGEKDEKAAYFGASVESGFEKMDIEPDSEGLAHISSSPIERARDTALIEWERLSETERRTKDGVDIKEKLATLFQSPEKATNEKYTHDFNIIVKMQEELEPAERNVIDTKVLKTLFDPAMAKEKGLQASYEEMADNLAARYDGFLKHINMLKRAREKGSDQPKEEPYVQIDVSHSFPIMSFLKKFLIFDDGRSAKDMNPDEFFDAVGGVIGESDSLELDYTTDEQGNNMIQVIGEFSPGKKFKGHIAFTQ